MESVVVVEVFCGVLVDQLQLKNVMKTVGLAIINKCPYAVFELIEGKMLSEVFKPMTREELTVISEKMIDTLCELEKIGFSHNGIHSNNVMIDKEGSPILIDYSKASIVHDGFIICCERDMKEFVSEDRFEQDRLYFEMSIYDKRY